MVKKSEKSMLMEMVFNLILPVVVLNKGGAYLGDEGPFWALMIALALPFGYAIYDYRLYQKVNIFSVLGLLNVLLTGGLALMETEGIWFAVKEAAMPLAIGLFVLFTAFTHKPLVKTLIFNDALLNMDKITQSIEEKKLEAQIEKLFRKSTVYLAGSFFLSATLNYALARMIFVEIPREVSKNERANLINEQIAQMNWMSYIVILVPSLIVTGTLMWWFFKRLTQLTGFGFQEIMRENLQ